MGMRYEDGLKNSVGNDDRSFDGLCDELIDGSLDGLSDGINDCSKDGFTDSPIVGLKVEFKDGCDDGKKLGFYLEKKRKSDCLVLKKV